VEIIDYINAVKKCRDVEEHDIWVLRDSSIDQIRKAVKYWVKMAQEPQREIQEKWVDCERRWVNINLEMKYIVLLEFQSPEDFVDSHDIVKQHAEQDSAWTVEIEKAVSMDLGQVKNFMKHPMKARAILQQLSVKIVKHQEWAVEVKEILSASMD
jgi:hypothetical protein